MFTSSIETRTEPVVNAPVVIRARTMFINKTTDNTHMINEETAGELFDSLSMEGAFTSEWIREQAEIYVEMYETSHE